MPKATAFVKNTNPTGDVWNVHTGTVARGDVVEVPADVAAALAEQVGNWLVVDNPTVNKES